MTGKEEEIARIARRLEKMVTKKSAVRGAGLGTPAPPRPEGKDGSRSTYFLQLAALSRPAVALLGPAVLWSPVLGLGGCTTPRTLPGRRVGGARASR